MNLSILKKLGVAALAFLPALVLAAAASDGPVEKQPVNISAIAMFVVFVLLTLGITYWAASRTKS